MSNTDTPFETLYDLCEGVIQAIETQHGNYFQGLWCVPVESLRVNVSYNYIGACGTAYCRAGWMIALAEASNKKLTNMQIHRKANALLRKAGIRQEVIDQLFSGDACSGFTPGSPAYAKAGADGVRQFMALYEKELKNVRLDDCRDESGDIAFC